jgi:hypothetical protein
VVEPVSGLDEARAERGVREDKGEDDGAGGVAGDGTEGCGTEADGLEEGGPKCVKDDDELSGWRSEEGACAAYMARGSTSTVWVFGGVSYVLLAGCKHSGLYMTRPGQARLRDGPNDMESPATPWTSSRDTSA